MLGTNVSTVKMPSATQQAKPKQEVQHNNTTQAQNNTHAKHQPDFVKVFMCRRKPAVNLRHHYPKNKLQAYILKEVIVQLCEISMCSKPAHERSHHLNQSSETKPTTDDKHDLFRIGTAALLHLAQ